MKGQSQGMETTHLHPPAGNMSIAVPPTFHFVHQGLEYWADVTPEAPALIYGEQRLSYVKVNQWANQIASMLKKHDIGFEKLVGMYLPRSIEWIVASMAIGKAGGSFLALSIKSPLNPLIEKIQTAQISCLVTTIELAPRLISLGVPLVCVDAAAVFACDGQKNLQSEIHLDNRAYAISTSGSSGKPKIVEIEHRTLHSLLDWYIHAFNITTLDRGALLAEPTFDAFIWEYSPFILCGASVAIPVDETVRLSELAIRDWLLTQQVTVAFLTTRLSEGLIKLPWPGAEVCSLRALLTGGERLLSYPPVGLPFVLYNNYGPTECTIANISGPVTPREPMHAPGEDRDPPPPLGWPIAGVHIHILDEQQLPVAEGAWGELYAEGNLARGYLGQPELTAQRFVTIRGKRLYKTGDIVCAQLDGSIAYQRRIDDMVKINGRLFEPYEVEVQLRAYPSIADAIVVVLESDAEEHVIVAAVTLRDDYTVPTRTDLHEFLAQKLESFKLPTMFVYRIEEQWPLTSSAKVDRKALCEQILQQCLPPLPVSPPVQMLTAIETQLVKIVAEILVRVHAQKVPQGEIDTQQHLFDELGISSLRVKELQMQIEETFSIKMDIWTIVMHPTIAELAQEIEAQIADKLTKGVPLL